MRKNRTKHFDSASKLVVQVHVMSSIEHRDALFSSDDLPFDPVRTVFVWSGKGDPFTKNDSYVILMFMLMSIIVIVIVIIVSPKASRIFVVVVSAR